MLMLCYLNYSGLGYRENSANGEDKLGFKCKIPHLKMRRTLLSLFDLLQSTGPASCVTGALPPPNVSLVPFNCRLKICEAKHEETRDQPAEPAKKTFARRMCLKQTHRSRVEVAGPQVTLQVPLDVSPLLETMKIVAA